MGQGLNDDALLVHEDDVAITKHLDIEGALTVLGVKRKGENTVKADLLNAGQPSVSEVFSQHHGERRWRHGHRAVAG